MIHPLALVDPNAKIANDARIGAFSVVEAGAEIGAGCVLASHVIVHTGSILRDNVHVDSFAVIGGNPQDKSFDCSMQTGVEIGEGTVVREHVTIHRSTKPHQCTHVGARCLLMAGAHIAHDCTVADDVILANGSMLGGHVEVGRWAFISGGVAIHQHCRVGSGALISANAYMSEDVAPSVLAHSRNTLSGLNLVGLRRRPVVNASIVELKHLYHVVFAPGVNCIKEAKQALEGLTYTSPEGIDFLEFFAGGTRGCFATPR